MGMPGSKAEGAVARQRKASIEGFDFPWLGSEKGSTGQLQLKVSGDIQTHGELGAYANRALPNRL